MPLTVEPPPANVAVYTRRLEDVPAVPLASLGLRSGLAELRALFLLELPRELLQHIRLRRYNVLLGQRRRL